MRLLTACLIEDQDHKKSYTSHLLQQVIETFLYIYNELKHFL